jgi:hypothetical protein
LFSVVPLCALIVFGDPTAPIDPLKPNTNIPGTAQLSDLFNGFATWALLAAVAGILIGAVIWAIGHHSANYQQAYSGRKGVIVSAAAALLIGSAPALVNFFFFTGTQVKASAHT